MIPSLAVQPQGQGVVNADNLNTFLQVALNVAQLRTFVGLQNMTVWMLGTTTPNDGGQGPFYWSSAATGADDNGATTIQPNGVTGPGRWLREPLAGGGSIPLSQIASIPSNTILGNNTGGTGPVLALTVSQVLTMLGIGGMSVPTGAMMEFAAAFAPIGWLVCDGSAVSRTGFANLFGTIGTTFGSGDGSTTFNLPDMRGRFARGFDTTGSIDPGRTFGTTQASALQSHQHITDTPTVFVGSQTSPFGDSTVSVTRTGFSTAGSGSNHYGLSNDGTSYSGYAPNPGGQVVSNETRPTNVAITYIIKT